jgi:DnaJ family protein B protein 13
VNHITSGYTEGWTYHGDHRLVFRNFFGGENPFDDLFPKKLGDEFDILPVLEPRTKKIQEPPVEETLLLSLEEAYLGCMKKMKLERREVLEPGGTSSKKSKILTINVKPGWKEGTKITFSKDGDQVCPSVNIGRTCVCARARKHVRCIRVCVCVCV